MERKARKIDAKEMTNPTTEIFQQACIEKWYCREESGNGTEPNQCQKLPNSSLSTGKERNTLLALLQKFVHDLLL